jgi:uncharacterized protein YdhG (YjbR/CyaY superfamily)
VIYFSGWKEHYSLYPASKGVVTALKKELAAYDVEKGTMRFPLDGPIPKKLIAAIAKKRAEEAAADLKKRMAAKKKTAAKKKAAATPER